MARMPDAIREIADLEEAKRAAVEHELDELLPPTPRMVLGLRHGINILRERLDDAAIAMQAGLSPVHVRREGKRGYKILGESPTGKAVLDLLLQSEEPEEPDA